MANFHHFAPKKKAKVTWSIRLFEKIPKIPDFYEESYEIAKTLADFGRFLSLFRENHQIKIVGPSRSPNWSRIPNFSTPLFFL
jgi:hypothetical protein